MSELVKAVKNKTTFYTTSDDIVRDYVTTQDLLSFIKLILQKEHINDYFDIYSKKPVSKKELLESFVETYALEYEVRNDLIKNSPTGFKKDYYSTDKKAEVALGYSPEFSAIEGILREAAYALNND
jgi:nucleoside-diphosphate-sugar epimerase